MKILATAFHAEKCLVLRVLYFRTLGEGKINHGCLVVKLAKTDTLIIQMYLAADNKLSRSYNSYIKLQSIPVLCSRSNASKISHHSCQFLDLESNRNKTQN